MNKIDINSPANNENINLHGNILESRVSHNQIIPTDLQESIKSKINRKINTPEYQSYINNSSFLNILKSFNNNTINNKYTRKLVTNYSKNQDIYQYIFGGIVKYCTEFLKIKNNINISSNKRFSTDLLDYYFDIRLDPLNYLYEFTKKIIHIFFYIIPKARFTIELFKEQSNKSISILKEFGRIGILKTGIFRDQIPYPASTHPLVMQRFWKYDRLNILLSLYNDIPFNSDIVLFQSYDYIQFKSKNDKIITKNKLLDIAMCKSLSFVKPYTAYNHIEKNNKILKNEKNLIKIKTSIENINKLDLVIIKIKLDIPLDFFGDANLKDIYNKLLNSSYISIKYYTYNNIFNKFIYGFKHVQSSSPIYDTLSSIRNVKKFSEYKRSYLINILSYCLYLLENIEARLEILTLKNYYNKNKHENLYANGNINSNRNTNTNRNANINANKNDENKIKDIIIVFYYLIIYCMPFDLGTASIAEMSLYTLWDTYINKDGSKKLIINPNIMFDVEALLMPFSQFHNNCLEKLTENDIYTPYFIIDY